MSSRSVRPFLPDLRRLEGELRLPIPERLRMIRELESDLEALTADLEVRGIEPAEARRRALEALVPSSAALRELDRVHAPPYRRLTRRMSPARLRTLERGTLGGVAAGVLVAQATALVRAGGLRDASPFMWPVLVLGSVLMGGVAAKAFQLWVKRDHAYPERGLPALLTLAAVLPVVALTGTLVDAYRMLGLLEAAPELAATLWPVWLVRACALLAVALVLSMAAGLGWLAMSQWVAFVGDARTRLLGDSGTHAPGADTPTAGPSGARVGGRAGLRRPTPFHTRGGREP